MNVSIVPILVDTSYPIVRIWLAGVAPPDRYSWRRVTSPATCNSVPGAGFAMPTDPAAVTVTAPLKISG